MGGISKIKVNFEVLLIIIFAGVFLYLALGEPWEHKISHPFPYSYLASDAFFHQATNQYIKEQGVVTNTPPYTVGGYEDVVDIHPPMLFQLTSSLSILSGLNVHDSIMIIAVLSFLFAILMIYLIWRQSNRNIAMLALPVCLLMLQSRLMPLIFWGYWLLLVGILFMVASLWAITKFELKFSYLPIALFLSATALAHQPEFVYVGFFFGIFLLVKIFKERKLSKDLIKKAMISSLLTIVLSFYSLLIFASTFMKAEGYRAAWDMSAAVGGYPTFDLANLGIIGIVALTGFILFLVSKKDKTAVSASVSVYCFLLGYLIYLGIGKRAYAHRLFWVMYLSFFFGFAVYYVLRLLIKKVRVIYPFIIAVIILLISANGIYGKTRVGQGIMNQYDWNALNWIGENLPEDAYVYYFYSDALTHNAPLYNSRRIAFNVGVRGYVEDIKSQQIKRSYRFSLADGYPTYLHKTGPLSFCFFNYELKPRNGSFECLKEYRESYHVPTEDTQKDICKIEYAYFDKAAREPVLAQYNMAIRDLLIKNDWIEEIYSNPLVSILKNNKPGVDCFGNYTG